MALTNLSTLNILISDSRTAEAERATFVGIKQDRTKALQSSLASLKTHTPRELRTETGVLLKLIDQYMAVHEQRQSERDPVKLAQLNQQATTVYGQVQADFSRLTGELSKDAQSQKDKVIHSYRISRNSNIAVLVVALGLAIGLGLWLTEGVRRPVNDMVTALDRLAAGDLTHEIKITALEEFGRPAVAARDRGQ